VLTRITVSALPHDILPGAEYLVSRADPSTGGTSLLHRRQRDHGHGDADPVHMIAHQYGDLIKKAKLKGGRLR
jgi:preprotein translocase subunit SecY